MASINPAPAITWLEAKTDIDELLTPSTVLPDVSFFQSKTETHTPFSWTYLDSPARESTVGYGQQLTFPLSKIGDLTGPIFLYLKVAPLLYGPVLDAGVTRALAASQLPATPTPSLGGLSQLDLLPTFIDFMGFALTDVVEFWVLGNKIDATSGDYTFLNQDQGVDENTSWVYTLPSNQGGTQNVGTLNSQDLYVPLDLWWTRDIRTSLRHNALMYSDGVLKIALNRAPIRADALSFQNETLDPTGHKLYAATNGQDVLPEQMYQRYVELRVGAAPARITVAVQQTNPGDALTAGYVPALALQFQTGGSADVLTTVDTALGDNVLKFTRRNTFALYYSQLASVSFPALTDSAGDLCFVWDYLHTAPLVTFSPATGSSRPGTGTPTASSLRLYGSFAGAWTVAALTIQAQGSSVFTVSAIFDGDPTSHVSQNIVMAAPVGTATFDGCPATPLAPVILGGFFFRIDPAVLAALLPGDTWSCSVTMGTLPLDLVLSDQPWGASLPAAFTENDAASRTVMFEYSDALVAGAQGLTLDSKTPAQIRGGSLPNWLDALDNGNVLYYHTGPATPAAVRGALAGMIIGVPSDGLSFDYQLYDPGVNVDVVSGGYLRATGPDGLFHPFFPDKAGRPALGVLPRGYSELPVYVYNVTNDPVYNTPVYTPVLDDQGIERFGGTGAAYGGTLDKVSLISTQFFLGTWEKQQMARPSFQQLMNYTESQKVFLKAGDPSGRRIKIQFGGPCKEIVFFFRPTTHELGGAESQRYWDWSIGATSDAATDFFATCQVLVNGQPLFPSNPAPPPMFFRHTVPCMNHASVPRQSVYTIPFAWCPDKLSPSGSFNLSAVQTVELLFEYPGGKLPVQGTLNIMGRLINVFSINAGAAVQAFQQ